jgi:phosphoribosyl 1,2-cyclic phosphodiesterase
MGKLRFASLGSGSRGNATLVQAGDTLLLLDCGFAARELERRCTALGVCAADIDAILVTHEHGDHVRGVGASARRFGIPVWMTHGTRLALAEESLPQLHLFGSHDGRITIGDLSIEPFAVPHDAREPVQYVFATGSRRFGVLTDIGSLTAHVVARLDGVDALLLECNHDPQLLADGPYPPSLQARVGGDYGHLANAQAADLLGRIDHPRLRHLVAGHLSEKNNTGAHVRAALGGVSPELLQRTALLAQDSVSPWFEV